jgi:hypothetical protein
MRAEQHGSSGPRDLIDPTRHVLVLVLVLVTTVPSADWRVFVFVP